ncbi:MAG: hypothetical protein JW715_02050 [Sedimentisphaerales bacterium]|nr:hypothetical protein [Sedimentisphaerales bacterium]
MITKERRLYGPWSWTEEDIRLLRRLYPRGHTKKIAERLGRPLTTVRQKAYDLGMKTNIYQYWRPEDLKLLREMYGDSSTKEIADRLGRSENSIKAKAQQLGLRKSKRYIQMIKSLPRKGKKKRTLALQGKA